MFWADALATPEIFHPCASVIASVLPSRVFTVSVDPAKPATVPRTRMVSAA